MSRITKRQPKCGRCVQKAVCTKFKIKLGCAECLDMIKKARNLDLTPLKYTPLK